MDLYARVNVLDGKAVRLPRGELSGAMPLDDPVERSRGWVARGADLLHIVDLDAAAYDDYRNRDLIAEIIASVSVPVQVGGGVRSPKEVERLLEAGAWRVTMGTVAIIDQVLLWDLCREHPGRIVVSLDVRLDEEIAIKGWTSNSGRFLEEVLIELSAAGAAGFMVAEVGRDVLLEPPDYDSLRTALSMVEQPVIAAGGVRDLADLKALTELEVAGRRLGGVVVGREVSAGRFTIEQAAALLSGVDGAGGPWDAMSLRAAARRYGRVAGSNGGAVEEFVAWLTSGET